MPTPDAPTRDTFQHLAQENPGQFRKLLDWPSDAKLNNLTRAELVA